MTTNQGENQTEILAPCEPTSHPLAVMVIIKHARASSMPETFVYNRNIPETSSLAIEPYRTHPRPGETGPVRHRTPAHAVAVLPTAALDSLTGSQSA